MGAYKTPAGTWGYRFWIHGDLEKAQGYESRRLALAAESTKRLEVGARRRGGDATPALAEWAALWFEQVAPHMAPGTLARYRHTFTQQLLPYLGAVPLDQLTRARIRHRLLTLQLKDKLMPNTVTIVRTALSACLTDAVEAGHLAVNPCLGIDRGRQRRGDLRARRLEPKRAHPMTRGERDHFLATVDADRHSRRRWAAAFFWIQAKAGCRPSETLGLRVEDLDWRAGTVRLWQQWVGGELRPLKTYEARTVHLSGGTLERLQAYLKGRTTGWLFPRPTNPAVPRELRRTRRVFRYLAREAGLTGYRLYDLRHTFASLHLAGGTPLLYVSAQLGHQSPQTTMRVYAHWVPEIDPRRWVERDSAKIVPLAYHSEPESQG